MRRNRTMKSTAIRLIAIELLLALSIPSVRGQVYYENLAQYNQAQRSSNHYRPIDWMKAESDSPRYTIAIRPLYLVNNGLKVDFEMELPNSQGNWIQLDAVIRFKTSDSRYDYISYWEAGDNWFTSLNGCGIGAYYKSYFRPNGWYYNVGLLLNYYGVEKPGMVESTFIEDGLNFIRYDRKMIRWNFFKPAVNFNIGKHFALTPRLFLDAFAGIGYTYSIHNGDAYKYFNSYDPRGFSYRGLYVSGGFRIGILWNSNK